MRKQKGNPIHMINQRNGARNVMMQRKYGWTLEVDIHGMRAAEAKKQAAEEKRRAAEERKNKKD